MKTKKLLSLILSVIMIMSVLPMYASAADPIQLTEANVVSYPTADGTIYAGHRVGDYITLKGGEVRYDADANGTLDADEVVPGTFEIIEEDANTIITTFGLIVTIKFVPTDTAAYSEIAIDMWSSCIVVSAAGRPVTITEYPNVPDIEPGARLSTITPTGGFVIDDETGNPVEIKAWTWNSSRTVVNESGYYPARFQPVDTDNYEQVELNLYVRVIGDTSDAKIATTIEELPTVTKTLYHGDDWSTVELTGGKAVDINGITVPGKFTINKTGKMWTSTKSVEILFTPDSESYATTTETLKITVEPCPIKFVDENGNAIVPEITVPYGTKVKDLEPRLKTLATNCNETLFYNLSANDDVSLTVGTHTLEVVVRPSKTVGVTPNYLDTTLTFKVIVEPKTVPMRLTGSVDEENTLIITRVNVNDSMPQGTYDVYVDGELYAENVPGKFTWAPEKSGEYNFRVVYNPIENDPCLVEEFTYQRTEQLRRVLTKVNTIGQGSISYTYGTEVTLTENVGENFGGWKITDANGNAVDLGVDTSGVKITFTMPDFNITVEAIDKSQSSTGGDAGDGTGDDANNGIFGGIWSFFQKLIDWFMNIIKQMMSLFGLGA